MFVYLVRHAIAVPRDTGSDVDDAERPLTSYGVKRFRRCVGALSALGVEVDEIWTSPLLRARQTAELLARLASFEGCVRPVDALLPGREASGLATDLSQCRVPAGIALVGHEPGLGRFASILVGATGDNIMAFKKGGIGCFEVLQYQPSLHARLCWMLTPAQLRRIR